MLKIKDIYEVAEYTGVGLNVISKKVVCLKCRDELVKCKCELRLMKCWCCGLNRTWCKTPRIPNPLQVNEALRFLIRVDCNKLRVKVGLPPTNNPEFVVDLINIDVTLCKI